MIATPGSTPRSWSGPGHDVERDAASGPAVRCIGPAHPCRSYPGATARRGRAHAGAGRCRARAEGPGLHRHPAARLDVLARGPRAPLERRVAGADRANHRRTRRSSRHPDLLRRQQQQPALCARGRRAVRRAPRHERSGRGRSGGDHGRRLRAPYRVSEGYRLDRSAEVGRIQAPPRGGPVGGGPARRRADRGESRRTLGPGCDRGAARPALAWPRSHAAPVAGTAKAPPPPSPSHLGSARGFSRSGTSSALLRRRAPIRRDFAPPS